MFELPYFPLFDVLYMCVDYTVCKKKNVNIKRSYLLTGLGIKTISEK